mmetsp:Transcript_53217/g.142351  ORF Transcript_53217/g.142351 Transcript_53217/m.142351 type:complete len:233 (-) Transcript_53217:2-700(-)
MHDVAHVCHVDVCWYTEQAMPSEGEPRRKWHGAHLSTAGYHPDAPSSPAQPDPLTGLSASEDLRDRLHSPRNFDLPQDKLDNGNRSSSGEASSKPSSARSSLARECGTSVKEKPMPPTRSRHEATNYQTLQRVRNSAEEPIWETSPRQTSWLGTTRCSRCWKGATMPSRSSRFRRRAYACRSLRIHFPAHPRLREGVASFHAEPERALTPWQSTASELRQQRPGKVCGAPTP